MSPSGGSGGATEGDLRGDHGDIINGLVGGVVDVANGHLLVHQAGTPAMTVVVDSGVGYIPNAVFSESDSDTIKFWEAVVAGTLASRTLTISANSSGSARIDLVCLKMDSATPPDKNASDVATLVVVAGTPGTGIPSTPSYHLKLAEITVANGASSIVNANIADLRSQLKIKSSFTSGKRVTSITSSATPAPLGDGEQTELLQITALSANATIGAPTTTPSAGKGFLFRIKDNGTPRTLTWNTIYRAIGVVLPATTVANKIVIVGGIYHAVDNKVDIIGVQQEA